MQVGRGKGFPVTLNWAGWSVVLVAYDVARARGQNSPAMDEVASLLPNIRPGVKALHSVLGLGDDVPIEPDYIGPPEWIGPPNQCKSKTVRFRAAHVAGAIQLLRYAQLVCGWGSAHSVLQARINRLGRINELDLLVDASR